jgi:ATP-dependent phosphoenolpyruvate carboxykinase
LIAGKLIQKSVKAQVTNTGQVRGKTNMGKKVKGSTAKVVLIKLPNGKLPEGCICCLPI